MGRRFKLSTAALVALALVASSCGGGGGGGGGSGAGSAPTPGQETPAAGPTATSTPVRAGSSRNEVTQSSDDGSITLRVQDALIAQGTSTFFTVLLSNPDGSPAAHQHISFQSGSGLIISLPDGNETRDDGSLTGSVLGLFGGSLTASTDVDGPFNGLSVTLTIIVIGGQLGTPTPTAGTPVSSATQTVTPTPTPLPCTDVQTIIVQTDTLNVSSQAGGTPLVTAVVFDSNNLPVSNINVLFDVQPRVGTFNPLVNVTGGDKQPAGQATSTLTIPPNSSFGTLNVTASACGKTGSVEVNIVSGVSTKPVNSVVLQADPSTVGSLAGGTINLTAAVFDADNKPINGIDVLFITAVGKVNPLVDRTKVSGAQGGVATSVLQIPANAVEQEYTITALAGGINGTTRISVVPGRGGPGTINPGVPPGEPASITLGASPTHIQVSGTGGADLAAVIGRVFDNNGNPLSGVRVHYHVVSAQSAPGAVILPVTTPTPSATPAATPTTLCSPDDPSVVSDTAGFAVIQVRSGTQPGPVTVAACTDTTINGVPSPLIEQQAVVTITSGPVARIGLTINSVFIDNNDGSLLTTASAVVTDAQGNTVEDGTPVFFEILLRRVCSGGSNDGQPCADNAICGGGTCVEDDTDPSRNVAISSNTTTNGAPPCDITQFASQTGIPISPQPGDAITCVKYPALQAGSEVLVRATVGGVVSSLSGPLTLPGVIGDLEVVVNPPTITVSDTSEGLAVVHATATNKLGDGVENVRVRFATTVGKISRSVLSDANGDADATLEIAAGTPSGTATLRVTGGGLQVPNISVPIVNSPGTPTPRPGDEPAAIQFVSAQPGVIGVRGSGLPEQSTITFLVTDATNTPRSGAKVMFSIARIADESITPNQATTDQDGKVQVTLTSGTRALSEQVTAQVTTVATTLVARSNPVNILGGPPSQPNFSLVHRLHNISGQVSFGIEDQITAFVADRFGNPVAPGTAVNFTTKGGAIGDPTATNALGQATATLVSQAPIADNGIVATLATTNGERPFVDTNGNGVCDSQDTLLPVSEPFYDANCNGMHDSDEAFFDLNSNGHFDDNQLPDSSGQPTCADQIVLFDSICTTFSGPTAALLINSGSSTVEAGGSRDFTLIVSDNPDPIGNPGVGNPIIGGSAVNITLQGGRGQVLGLSSFTIPDAQTNDRIIDGINRFRFSVSDNLPTAPTSTAGSVVVSISSDPGSLPGGGNGSVTVLSPLTFLAAPTPTPTPSLTATITSTPTPTPAPPAIAPSHTTLAAGTGAQPDSCNGATQAFVVTGGSPPFTVFTGGGCVSATQIPASGGSFTFTAGNTLGDFSVTVTDALGRTVSAGITVLGPPTPSVTPTGPPTATPTIAPPAIAPASTTLFAGTGAPPSCNGVKRTFVVTGGAPPFSLSASGVGCLNPSTIQVTGESFTYTSGNEVGNFVITATDSLGRIATTNVAQQGAPASFMSVDLFAERRADNGDGSFTSILTALLTDSSGATVPDGVPVEFSLVVPVAGVSITSPGFTNQAANCDLNGLTAVPQPGDALACIKYVSSRQGSTITVRARATTADGGIIVAEQTITLPDTRPTPTVTITPTPQPSSTPTVSPTVTPFPSGVATFTPTATATLSPTPPLGSIEFLGANPTIIGVRGSGRPEQSIVTFRVKNTLNAPIVGVPVTFQLTGSGTESLNPLSAITSEDGTVVTTITSGTRASTIRVTAGGDTNGDGVPDIFAQSAGLSILGGPPAKNRFSIAPALKNVPGRVRTGVTDQMSAFVNDRFGNAVPAGTAVSFVTNASSVVNPSTTDLNGVAQATLLSEQVVPATGIVSVMAFTLGEESFLDNNGNGKFDAGDTLLTDDIPEPFVDFRPLPPALAKPGQANDSACPISPPSGLCNGTFDPATPFEFFIDTPPLDGVWGKQGKTGVWDNDIFVFDSTFVTFSGPLVPPVASPNALFLAPGDQAVVTVEVHDDLLNPLAGGSTLLIKSDGPLSSDVGFVTISGSPITIPDGHSFNRLVDGLTRFSFVASVPATSAFVGEPFTISMNVSSPNGTASFNIVTGKILANTPTPTPLATATPTPKVPVVPGSIQFVSATPSAIGVHGSGLPEQSVLTYRVNSTQGDPVPNVAVQFTLVGTGSESLSPLTAISDENGLVETTLTSGVQATSIRVTASLVGNSSITAQSTAVSIVGAPPAVNHFSIAAARFNVPGRVSFGVEDQISAFVNDRFGNAVPAGTSVSFITNAASVVNPTATDTSGVATATLLTEGMVPPSGIVTVMAYTRGEESFLDNNGNGVFDAGDTILTDDLPEPFIDFRPLPPADAGCNIPAPSRFCNGRFDPGTTFERFVDTNNNLVWDSGPPPANTLGQGQHGVWDNDIFVFGTIPVTFSGPTQLPTIASCSSPPCDGFSIANGGSKSFTINVHDDLRNPLVGGSTIAVTSSAGSISGGSITIPDGESFNQLIPGLTQFTFVLSDADATTVSTPATPTTVVVTVTSANGNATAIIASGTIQ